MSSPKRKNAELNKTAKRLKLQPITSLFSRVSSIATCSSSALTTQETNVPASHEDQPPPDSSSNVQCARSSPRKITSPNKTVSVLSCARKQCRTIAEEKRKFNPEWEEEFFFIQCENSCKCLICDAVITVFKRCNVSDHFMSKHSSFVAKYPAGTPSRSKKLATLKKKHQDAIAAFGEQLSTNQGQKNLMASIAITWKLAAAKKPYTDAAFIKACALEMVEVISSEKEKGIIDKIRDIPLSASTATRRVTSCIQDIDYQMSTNLNNATAISLAVDESTDIGDTAQCCIFVRAIDKSGNLTDDLLDLVPLIDRTRGSDVLDAVLRSCERFNIPMDRIYSLATDGAPAMVGCRSGFVTLFKELQQTRDDIITYHCIIHQQSLASMHGMSTESMANVMESVVAVVNYIRSNALNHRTFKKLLNEYESYYDDLVYHSEVRWLSKGEVLRHFYHTISAIIEFLESQLHLPDYMKAIANELRNKQWIEKLVFLTDITTLVNNFNKQLQGKDMTICDLYIATKSFINKLKLLERHLQQENPNVMHFERLQNLGWKVGKQGIAMFCGILHSMQNEFTSRFKDFESNKALFMFTSNPFLFDTEELKDCSPYIHEGNLAEAELQLIDLQCNEILKRTHQSVSTQQFWQEVHQPVLKQVAFVVLSMFGSSYSCEQTFSTLTYVKNRYRARLTNEHTTELVKAAVTKVVPQFDKIAKTIQAQSSH